MNDDLGFIGGVTDATIDLADGWVPANYTLDSVVSQLRVNMGSSDQYIAGYLSVLFSK